MIVSFLKKGEPVPVDMECMAVAGHVTVNRRKETL